MRFISPERFEIFSLNFCQMFFLVRRYAKPMTQLRRLDVFYCTYVLNGSSKGSGKTRLSFRCSMCNKPTVDCVSTSSKCTYVAKALTRPLKCVDTSELSLLAHAINSTVDCVSTSAKCTWLFLAVPWIGLQCVIVLIHDHTHFLCFECE